MCGRYSKTEDLEAIEERFEVRVEGDYKPNYNASPGQILPVITNTDPKRLTFMKWWLLPHWSKKRSLNTKPLTPKYYRARLGMVEETEIKKPPGRVAFYWFNIGY